MPASGTTFRLSLRGLALTLFLLSALTLRAAGEPIDREEVVRRYNVRTTETLGRSPAQVGNGKFAFGMDITGLQTFTAFNTLSDWGWHSDPLPEGKTIEDYSPTRVESYGKSIPYILDDPDEPEITKWLKANPHRINLGRIGFILYKEDGSEAVYEDLEGKEQVTDLWTGLVTSKFSLEGTPVTVRTACHPDDDAVSVSVESELLRRGRLALFLDFPYREQKEMTPFVGDWSVPSLHETRLQLKKGDRAIVTHRLDSTEYSVRIAFGEKASIRRETPDNHRYIVKPSPCGEFRFTALFSPGTEEKDIPDFEETVRESALGWKQYWMSGAALDLSGSSDPRWEELERRVVLSQFLMRLNESGLFLPQEAGLVNNGWWGRFHFEMAWWHGVHYYLWDRGRYASCYYDTYVKFLPEARNRAASEGRKGARWPKCTGDINREWPCVPHAMLVWQQPHPIYFAEQEYRKLPTPATLEKWRDIVIETADYMADCVFWDSANKRYVIGPPVLPVSENTDPYVTLNPAFEVGYFKYGLRTALTWADRMGLKRSRTAKWRKVYKNLSELPREDGLYTTYEGIPDMWTKYNYEHPALTGVLGMLPGDGVDRETFRRTLDKIYEVWEMDRVWGWDYPMMAMAEARMGNPEKAVDLLTTTAHKFSFDAHGFADVWPFPYFPANGGLLTAVAMMCGGWDGSQGPAPGFPKEGWTVRYEGFKQMQ